MDRDEATAKRIVQASRTERELLGSLMRPGADRDKILALLHPSDFSTDAHQTLADAIRDLWLERQPVELLAVLAHLRRTGRIANLGPSIDQATNWVAELHSEAPSGMLADPLSAEVIDASRKRQLGYAAQEILADCAAPDGSAEELIDRASARMFALADQSRAQSRLRSSAEATNAAMDEYDRKRRGESTPGVLTGLADLDAIIGGLPFSQLTILAARPSVGKTALAHQICRHAAKCGMPALFASLEQRYVELGTRGIAAESGVCGQMLSNGKPMFPDDQKRIGIAVDHLRGLNFHYDDTSGQSALHILGTARGLKRKSGLSLVVVDYLQLVAPDDAKASRNDQLDVITKRIRNMARELDVAVLALSQLSRDSEKQARRPRLSDLRDSGAIEQHADAVMMLHRPETPNGDIDAVELAIEKQRNGPIGLVKLAYRRKVLTFENMARGIPQ